MTGWFVNRRGKAHWFDDEVSIGIRSDTRCGKAVEPIAPMREVGEPPGAGFPAVVCLSCLRSIASEAAENLILDVLGASALDLMDARDRR